MSVNEVAIPVLCAADLLGVGAIYRMLRYDPAPGFSSMWLRRRARRALAPGGLRRRAGVARRLAAQRVRALPSLVFALPLLIFAPISFQHGLFRGDRAQDFLETLWQVVAASLGLSVALIAFAFEAFMTSGQRAYGGALRDFAHDTQLSVVLYLGIAAIVTIGAVVFGWGEEAPGGWAAAVATVLALATFAGLAYVFAQVTSALDPRRLHAARLQRLRGSVGAVLDAQLLRQMAAHLVDLWGARNGVACHPYRLGFNATGYRELETADAGIVTDIALGRLAREAARERKRQSPRAPVLLTEVGFAVGRGDSLLALDSGVSARRVGRAKRAFRVRNPSQPEDDLREHLERLHEEALTAIRSGRTRAYGLVADTYFEVLLAFPRAAAERDLLFVGAVAQPDVFRFTPLQQVERQLYEEAATALRGESREIALEAVALPVRVAGEASRLGADALVQSMLRLYPAIYVLATTGG